MATPFICCTIAMRSISIPAAAGFAAVISGHSHRPLIEWRHGVLYLNPGSAGPRRFSLPISLGLVTIRADSLQPRLVTLP